MRCLRGGNAITFVTDMLRCDFLMQDVVFGRSVYEGLLEFSEKEVVFDTVITEQMSNGKS